MGKMFQTFEGSRCLHLLDPDNRDITILQKVVNCLPLSQCNISQHLNLQHKFALRLNFERSFIEKVYYCIVEF